MATTQYYGTGRRKTSTARVFLRPGTGQFNINKLTLEQYFGRVTARMIVKQPLELTETADKLDLPHSVVEKVLNDFLLQLPKFIFPYRNVKRISLFGFININIRKFLKKNNNN